MSDLLRYFRGVQVLKFKFFTRTFFSPKHDLSVWKKLKRESLPRAIKSDSLHLFPSCLNFQNSQHFHCLLSIMIILLCNNTNIENGSFVFVYTSTLYLPLLIGLCSSLLHIFQYTNTICKTGTIFNNLQFLCRCMVIKAIALQHCLRFIAQQL